MFFKNGKKIDEVVGANIAKVEQLVNSLGQASGGFPSSGGRVLGTGNATFVPKTFNGAGSKNDEGLTVMQQQYFIFGGLLLVFGKLPKLSLLSTNFIIYKSILVLFKPKSNLVNYIQTQVFLFFFRNVPFPKQAYCLKSHQFHP